MSYYLDLFSHIDKERLRGFCQVWIMIKSRSKISEKSPWVISAECVSIAELEESAAILKKEIYAIVKKGKRKFAEAAKIKAQVRSGSILGDTPKGV